VLVCGPLSLLVLPLLTAVCAAPTRPPCTKQKIDNARSHDASRRRRRAATINPGPLLFSACACLRTAMSNRAARSARSREHLL
jgi:hypothetical protein